MIIIPSCRVHGSHLVKFRRGQLLKNIPAVQSEKHEQTKDRIHLCLYFTNNEKPTLCMPFSPTLLFHGNCSIPPPPSKHSPPQQCGVSSLMLLLRRLFSAFTNSARAIFVWGDSLLISLTHSLTNRFRDRKLQCALGLHLPKFLSVFPSHIGKWKRGGLGRGAAKKGDISIIAITCCIQW